MSLGKVSKWVRRRPLFPQIAVRCRLKEAECPRQPFARDPELKSEALPQHRPRASRSWKAHMLIVSFKAELGRGCQKSLGLVCPWAGLFLVYVILSPYINIQIDALALKLKPTYPSS